MKNVYSIRIKYFSLPLAYETQPPPYPAGGYPAGGYPSGPDGPSGPSFINQQPPPVMVIQQVR